MIRNLLILLNSIEEIIKNLFNDVKDVKQYHTDDNNDDFDDNKNIPSER